MATACLHLHLMAIVVCTRSCFFAKQQSKVGCVIIIIITATTAITTNPKAAARRETRKDAKANGI